MKSTSTALHTQSQPSIDREAREELAAAHQICAALKLDDLTYTHLSVRPDGADYFFIGPFGLMFEEMTASNLLKVDMNGKVLEGQEHQYNQTGYVIHGSIYRHRPDIHAIFHLHTHAGVAVSAMKDGLLPVTQWALHFYNRIAYHDYDSLALTNESHEARLVRDLADKYVMLLRNHGMVTCGRDIQEAMFYTHHLEQACKAQCLLAPVKDQLLIPSPGTCEKTVQDLLSFEKNLGHRDWQALLRMVERRTQASHPNSLQREGKGF